MEKKRSPLRSPGILLVALVVLIAATGLVYAHWTTTLRVDANVNTGNVYTEWLGAFTNDDGTDNADGEDGSWPEAWDAWGPKSSADPSEPAMGGDRYDKDVAGCWADAGGDALNIWVGNAYPSYHCAIQGEIANKGSIPVRVTAINAYASFENRCGFWEEEFGEPGPMYEGPVVWDESGNPYTDDGNGNPGEPLWEDCRSGEMAFVPGPNQGNFSLVFQDAAEITGDIALGLDCGFQIDPLPCEWRFADGSVHEGHVDRCDLGDENDESACAYNDDWDNLGPVEEFCDGPTYDAIGWFHVEQEADQNTNYHWSFEQEFVNWNEWSPDLCSPGVPIVNGDGSDYTG